MSRTCLWAAISLLAAAACGNNPDPRVIAGGGIGDGSIDGTLNVYVIDTDSQEPLADALVAIGSTQMMTDESGLVVFSNVSGPQTIAVKANGYRSTVWQGANGVNVTIPVTTLGTPVPPQALIKGDIVGTQPIVMNLDGHVEGLIVSYSQNDELADAANHIVTPANGNVLFFFPGIDPPWHIYVRPGTVTLTASVFDNAGTDTPALDDDIVTVLGWATAASFHVDASVPQDGKTLTMLDPSQVQNVTIDYGTPPSALTDHAARIGIELANGEVVRLPDLGTDSSFKPPPQGPTRLVPRTSAFAPDATYRLTATAQTADGARGPQSTVVRRGLGTSTLSAAEWLEPPQDVAVTRTSASFDAVSGAKLHSVQWSDSTGILLEVTTFDGSHSVEVPDFVALTTSNPVTAKVQGIGADIDVTNFSFATDKPRFWGTAVQPIDVP